MAEIKKIFSIGDNIIDFENIYKIISEKEQEGFSGKTLSYFFYEPIGKTNQKTTYSIPVNNISKSGLRHLIDLDTAKKLYEKAKEKIDHDSVFNFMSIKEILYENNPEKSIYILKQLFLEREKNTLKFSRTNKETLESILKHISDEIAFVSKTPFEEVQVKLTSLIEKAIK